MDSRYCTAVLVLMACFAVALSDPCFAQSRTNSSGTGGIHTIQGRIYLPSGRTPDSLMIVRLDSTNFGTITVNADQNGGFSFRSLAPGNYSVVIDAGANYEISTESITIDTEVQGPVRLTPTSKTVTLPIHLRPKRSVVYKSGIINAKWSSVPRAAIDRYQSGLDLVRENRTTEAAAEFRRSLEVYPSFSPAHTSLGKIFLQTGNLNEAISAFRLALRYDPTDFDAQLDLGIALLNLRKYNDAEAELVTAAYLNRSAVTPHYYLGIVFVMKNDLDIARKAFETAKELKGSKSLPALHKYLGRIYMAKSMKKEAIEELETYLKLMPKAQDIEKVRKDISDLKSTQN